MNKIYLPLTFALLMTLLIGCSSKPDMPTLHLFTWSNLIDPDVISEFEEKYHCRVVTDIYDSNESMYAKLKLSSARYDLICPSSYYVNILEKQNIIQALDQQRLKNLEHLDPAYFTKTPSLYAVPFIVSFSGIGYRKDRLEHPENSYDIFSQDKLRGRMTMLNDAREAIGAALKFHGYSINSRSAAEVDIAAEQLIKWKQNLAKFDSEQYKPGLASGEFLAAQAYSVDIVQLQSENKAIDFLFPAEGAIVSIDCLSIPAAAQNVDLAYEFINFMIDTEIAAKNSEYIGALVPVMPSYPLLSEDMRLNPIFFPPADALKKMQRIEDLQGDVQMYYKAWERVKAG